MIYLRITNREELERTVELGKTPESKHLEFKNGRRLGTGPNTERRQQRR
jgi:hypothetical protein